MKPEMPLEIGLRVDVLDDEGIWNTGVIVDIGKEDDDLAEIKYDGWGEEYNQWIEVSSQRLAPLHTYTLVKKCWAKLTKWPWWPAFVVLRAPTTDVARAGLESETKLYVEFFDAFNENKRSRCWMQKKNVESFRENFEERASKNIGKSFPQFVEGTQRARAGTSPLLFTGTGTLPIEYSTDMPDSVAEKKAQFSRDTWYQCYKDFSNKYQELYGYTTMPAPKTAGSKRAAAPAAKRAKGPKGRIVMRKDEPSEDEDESEEKEEEPEASEVEEEDEDEEEEEDYKVSARGRRSSRLQQKRKQPAPRATRGSTTRGSTTRASTTTPARRNTRARRVKVIEELLESSSLDSVQRQPANTGDSDGNGGVLADSGPVVAKAEPSLPAHSGRVAGPEEVHVDLSGNFSMEQSNEEEESESSVVNGEYSSTILRGEESVSSAVMSPTSRRKCAKTRPTKLSDALRAAKKAREDRRTSSPSPGTERDPGVYRYWSGGSRYEVDSKPWSIHGWFMHGIKQKVQE